MQPPPNHVAMMQIDCEVMNFAQKNHVYDIDDNVILDSGLVPGPAGRVVKEGRAGHTQVKRKQGKFSSSSKKRRNQGV